MQKESSKVTYVPAPPPGILKKPELYALSIGQVIGAGVITLVGPAMALTGYSAWLAYGAAIIWGFLMIMPVVMMVPNMLTLKTFGLLNTLTGVMRRRQGCTQWPSCGRP